VVYFIRAAQQQQQCCVTTEACELYELGREPFLAAMEERPTIKREFVLTILTREEDAQYTPEERCCPDVLRKIHGAVERRMNEMAKRCPLMAKCCGRKKEPGDPSSPVVVLPPPLVATNGSNATHTTSQESSASRRSSLPADDTGSPGTSAAGTEGSAGTDSSMRRIGSMHPQHEAQAIPWQKRDRIGEGGFGTVYSAVNSETGQPLAVKVIPLGSRASKSLLRAVRQESELMQSITHPNVVRGFGLQVDSHNVYVLMELLKSGSLDQVLSDVGPLPEAAVRSYTIQVLDGLAYLHQKGILHRDIKPGNLLLSESGTVKLADFGISRLVSAQDSFVKSSSIAGTPAYLSPEAIQGRYSISSDLWAVGCTVLQLVAGRVPYSEKEFENSTQLIFYIYSTNSPPHIPPATPMGENGSISQEGHVTALLSDFLKSCFAAKSTSELRNHAWLTAPSLPVKTMFHADKTKGNSQYATFTNADSRSYEYDRESVITRSDEPK
jgi:serine/threonine protein kinase